MGGVVDKAGSNVSGCMWRWYLHVLLFSVNPWVLLLGIRASSEDVLEFHYVHVVSYHECDSQTRPQEFMHPREEYLHLHTSNWIQHSHCLHIAFALEIEQSGD